MMDAAREALVVATDFYDDPELQKLRAPTHDAEALAEVLSDAGIGAFHVRKAINQRAEELQAAIGRFFRDRRPQDLLLLYLSCHGIKAANGRLFFAATNTSTAELAWTGVPAEFVNDRMRETRASRVVLMLDCCYSGAFAKGMVAKGDNAVGVKERFEGRGRVVLTSSDAMEYSFEAGAISGQGVGSVFTSALVEGLRTGRADRDQDGQISVDELYDYVEDRVGQLTSDQQPGKWTFDVHGSVVIARSRIADTKAALLTEAEDAMAREDWLGAVRAYEKLLKGSRAEAPSVIPMLTYARQQRELELDYELGRRRLDEERWDEALEVLRRVRSMGGDDYKDVAALIGSAEGSSTRPKPKPTPPPVQPIPPPPPKWWRRFRRELLIGTGALVVSAVIAVAVLVFAGPDEEPGNDQGGGGGTETVGPGNLEFIESSSGVYLNGAGTVAAITGAPEQSRAEYVAAGARSGDAAVWTSRDGRRWSGSGDSDLGGSGAGEQAINGLLLSGDHVIGVGTDGEDVAVWMSEDAKPTDWQEPYVLSAEGAQVANRVVGYSTSFGTRFVMVGYDDPGDQGGDDKDAAVWLISADGEIIVPDDEPNPDLGGPGEQEMTRVVRTESSDGEDVLVAVGFETVDGDTDAVVWKSSDATSWDAVSDGDAIFSGSGTQRITDANAEGERVVAVGEDHRNGTADAAVWISDDGADTWRSVHDDSLTGSGEQVLLTRVLFVDAAGLDQGFPPFLAAGTVTRDGEEDAALWTSLDGERWTRENAPMLNGQGQQRILSLRDPRAAGQPIVAVGVDDGRAAIWSFDARPRLDPAS